MICAHCGFDRPDISGVAYIAIKHGAYVHGVAPWADINYIKHDSKYSVLALNGKTVIVDTSLSEIVAQSKGRLVRIHRNAAVNKAYIENIMVTPSEHLITMTDGATLNVSRRRIKEVKEALQQHAVRRKRKIK